MLSWVEKKYAGIIGLSLERFKVTKQNPYSAAFRCVYCGDSQKSKFKTRGHFYEKRGHIGFHCFNCGVSKSFSSFLYDQSPHLYKEFKLESLKENGEVIEQTPIKKTSEYSLKGLKKVSQLPLDHPCRVYCDKRKIPFSQHYRLYYVDKFCTWINTLVPDKFSEKTLNKDEPRLVIPFFDENNELFGVQGRILVDNSDKLRYITIMFKEDKPKVFGLEKLKKDEETFIVEGPIDSLYLNNCLALSGSDGNFETFVNKKLTTIIFDNEPRNNEIMKKVDKYITSGWRVCIWPNDLPYKDISDIVQAGLDPASIISNNTFSDLEAKMKFVAWRKK